MDVRYLLLLIFLVSCLPQSGVSPGNLSDDQSTQTTSGSGSGSSSTSNLETQWNFLGALSKTITINVSNLNNSYIVGKDIESFLNTSGNFSQDYCLVSRYSISGLTHELRTRVVPISYYDFTAKRTVRILRVDFHDLANSQSICSAVPLLVLDSNGNHVTSTAAVNSTTHDPSQLCTTCTSTLSSSKIMIFRRSTLDLKELSLAQVDIRALSLSIDPNNASSGNTGVCSQSACVARGFDCCLDNQCITDGAIRPSAVTQYSSQLQSAEQERLNNPLAYLNYPHLYYICGTSVPTSTGGSSSGGSYDQGLTQLKKDYYCVEHMKKFKTGSTFHQDVISGVSFFPDETDIPDVINNNATLYPADIECRNDTDPSSTMYFKKVVERLYQNCGCAKTTLEDMVAYCPAYEYSVNYFENSGLPNRIDCYTPPNNEPQIPSQQTVSVNSRSAPHRYFRTCGDEFGSTAPCSTGDNQEGDAFSYQDEGNILPAQQDFGMNSILGQMNVTLDKAIPAKTVNVELDQVYQITTTSGFYSPCPTCGKDSWFTSFSAHPTSAYGVGLQTVGHTTSRDEFAFNTTGGNYEDTIFGRACWIPPTMLPFSHFSGSSVQDQRLKRLKTQAALYANGYQRDWYGFNKGALIGSFDGVSWFAIGKGRIVRSTTKKLFLAINAPFADLASPTLHVVNVQAYDGYTQAAQVDYDPQYHLSHPYQNEAGNCQSNHLCSTDTDCITRLGWEYMCADVAETKTIWPTFDVNANEIAGGATTLTIDQILLQKRFPSTSTKRCVYRGAGALCHSNLTSVSNLNQRKTLACAPNFYCANVASAGAVFNSKVSRYAANLEDIPVTRNHYFGKDANVLGRPLSYMASGLTTTIPNDIRTNLQANMAENISTAGGFTGICRPGKALPEAANQTTMFSPYAQHAAADPSGRTDFISQIGACNSGLFTSYRYSSCPIINSEGNHEFLSTSYSSTNYHIRARNQNSCGLDSLLSTAVLSQGADTLLSSSPFRNIEARPLHQQTAIEPTFARDACLRRAGQVCHTDLDCGPNKMHADQTENFSLAYFGNEAEKKYYSEYLVCGQADPKPSPSDTNFKTYDMSKNRCCREVGSDLTTYTAYVPLTVEPNSTSNTNSTTTDDTYDRFSFGLKMTLAPGTAPNDPYRYSRLASVENLGTTNRPMLNAFQDRSGSTITTAQSANVMTPYQWKTLGEANSESCCGGGWIRKFADGTNDWTKRDRLYIDVKNFSCINSRTPLLTKPADMAGGYSSVGEVTTLVAQDYDSYCKDALGVKGSCAQFSINDTLSEISPTTSSYSGIHLKTADMVFSGAHKDFYFYPRSMDSDKDITIDNSKTNGRRNINIKVPSYIRTIWDTNINAIADGSTIWTPQARVSLFQIGSAGEYPCVKKNSMTISSPTITGAAGLCQTPLIDGAQCCYSFDPSTRIVKVVPAWGGIFAPSNTNIKVGAILINTETAGLYSSDRKTPGSNSYYLKRLGLLELNGIPQVTYKPLMCSDNSNRIVPGLFKKTGVTDMMVSDFNTNNYSFTVNYTDPVSSANNYSGRLVNRHALQSEQIFAENEFKCCTPLGKTTTDQTKCCSGYGLQSGSGSSYTCALPIGTDLMVYFNRFVSNEGVGTDKPGGGLVETDFYALTGEPILSTAVNQKISALGSAYCESGKVRQGGAFGEFRLEPMGNDTNQNEKIYGILDSSNDEGELSSAGGTVSVGYSAFMAGFRWNHHLYCDE